MEKLFDWLKERSTIITGKWLKIDYNFRISKVIHGNIFFGLANDENKRLFPALVHTKSLIDMLKNEFEILE